MERGRSAWTWARAGWLGVAGLALAACGDGDGAATVDAGVEVEAGDDAAAELPTGSIGFEIADDLAVAGTITVDEGGELQATSADGVAITLRVPPYALASDVDVTLVPLSAVEGVGDPSGVTAVLLEPDGLWLQESATLSFAVAAPDDPALLAFASDPGGESVGATLVDPSSDALVVELRHFRLVGVGTPSDEQRAAFYANTASDPELTLEHATGAVLAEGRRARLSDAEAPALELSDALAAYDAALLDRLYAGAAESCTTRSEFMGAALDAAWLSGLVADPLTSQLASRMLDVYGTSAAACTAEALSLCRTGSEPGYLLELSLREARLVALLASVEAISPPAATPLVSLVEDARRECAIRGYEASIESDELSLAGQVDDPRFPFVLTGTLAGDDVRFVYTPDATDANAGTYSYGDGEGPSGSGTYTLSEQSDGAFVLEQAGERCVPGGECTESAEQGVLSPA